MAKIWKPAFAKKITQLTGYFLSEADINSDEYGYHYYIRQLSPGYPLILKHYRGPLFTVIPYSDYLKLESGAIDVDTYINSSHWSYGYFWGGGSILGAYWQPFEIETGIHKKDKIYRYLKILSCRTSNRSSGYRPDAEHCKRCPVDCRTCPFSSLNKTGSWDKEVQEYDPRVAFLEEITERTRCSLVRSHTENNNELHLRKCGETLIADVPQHILNNMLYHPDEDWAKAFEQLSIVFDD